MKTLFLSFAAVLLATSLDLTTAAACDKTTQVDSCDNKECTYQNFNVTHVPDPRSKLPYSTFQFNPGISDDLIRGHQMGLLQLFLREARGSFQV